MAILESIATVGLAAGGGGILGMAGSLLGRVAGFFENRQAFQQKQAGWKNDVFLREHEIQLHRLQQEARKHETEQELDIIAQAGSYRGLESSLKASRALNANPSGSPWVINVLRLVRPVLTIFLLLLVAWIFKSIEDPIIRGEVMSAVVFSATTAVAWWYGDRAPRKGT